MSNREQAAQARAKQPSILAEAELVIYGDREQTYGSPDKNLQVIANLWNSYLGHPPGTITVDHVCDMMILLKVARLKNQPDHRDSQVDICGYAALKERIQNQRKVSNESSLNSQAAMPQSQRIEKTSTRIYPD